VFSAKLPKAGVELQYKDVEGLTDNQQEFGKRMLSNLLEIQTTFEQYHHAVLNELIETSRNS
jgi:hypothetical protein